MSNPVIPLPPFPNVPNLPGVPQLVRASAFVNNVQLAVGAVSSILGLSANVTPTWGIFDASGNLVVQPDSFLEMENTNDWKISNFPLQDGEFNQFNKVVLPFETSVKLSKGGSAQDRKNLLAQVGAIAGNTNLYTIRTPETSYVNVNIHRWTIRRMGNVGAYFFADLELFFQQITSATSQYSTSSANTINAQNPNATPTVNQGTQSAQTPVPSPLQATIIGALENTPN
jgi:hypothetical protein